VVDVAISVTMKSSQTNNTSWSLILDITVLAAWISHESPPKKRLISVIFRFEDSQGHMVDWTPGEDDIARWRDTFQGLNIFHQLEMLAEWTVNNQSVKRKRRKMKNCVKWISRCLKKQHDQSTGHSAIHQARTALAEPEWKRLGFESEDAWDKKQAEIYYKSLQKGLALPERKGTEVGDKALGEALETLRAIPNKPLFGRVPIPAGHEHTFIDRIYSEPMCDCGAFKSQWEDATNFELERAT